ncbi:vascular cell adhesion protein 1-like [Mantella aurantiaca]
MELTINRLCLLLYICGVIHTGWSQKKCELQVESTQVFAPINEWILLNCTYTCSKPIWESRLQKRNTLEGDDWVSIEVLVNDWETSSISCISSDGEAPKSTVTVSAYALPTTVTIDLDEELEEGQQHEVTCTVFEVAPLANLQISVMREGKVIEMSTFARSTNKGKQSLSETYYFTVTRRDNLQGFYCQATLELGTVEDNAVQSKKINVKTFAIPELPVISITPARIVKEGESVTLTCQSEGFPEPEYSWEIPPNAHVTYSQENSKVTITKATFTHKGSYLCMAKNKHGRVRGEEYLDIINNPGAQPDTPFIMVLPHGTVKEGESLNLTCHSGGHPEPEYFWTIPSIEHVYFSADKTEIFITKATSAHNGTYQCEAQNTNGKVKNQLVIRIIGQSNGVFHTRPTAILLASLALLLALL